MRQHKPKARTLGLFLVTVIGTMLFSAVTAQAENLSNGGSAGLYRILGSSTLTPLAGFTGSFEGLNGGASAHALLLVPGRKLSVLCGFLDVLGGTFLSDTEALMELLYLGCTPRVLGEEVETVAGCEITNARSIKATALALAKKHEAKRFVLFQPDFSSRFATIEFESGKGCALPLKNEISGSVVAEVKEEKEVVVNLLQLSESIQKLFQVKEVDGKIKGDNLLFGAFASYIDASAVVELKTIHTGCSFGIV